MIVGIFCCVFGLVTIVARIVRPSMLGKLVYFKKIYGDKKGGIIHFISYSVLPIVIGIIFIINDRLNAGL